MEGASCQVSWDSQSLLNMWNLSVQLGNENMLTDEFSAKFTTAVQEHTNSVYGINLEKYPLKAASLMGLRVSQESTLALHIYSSQILFVLLNFLHVEFQNNCRLPF
ncbi:Hypothetical protein NTJ_07770 [Nesidiocoris tenuis]|nr:Hypothetical protein NTJ_07770 [Nesidiocoris tenuis]